MKRAAGLAVMMLSVAMALAVFKMHLPAKQASGSLIACIILFTGGFFAALVPRPRRR